MKHNLKSVILVSLQFLLLAAISWYCGIIGGLANKIILTLSGILVLWAILTLKFRVNVFPTVMKNQQLYTRGPYRFVRHPMYTSLLLMGLGIILNRIDWVSVMLWLFLLANMITKLLFEEALLKQRFAEYDTYMKKSFRLLPFVY